MKTLIQWILLLLFVSLILFVLVPSYQVLSSAERDGRTALQEPPKPPALPALPPADPKVLEEQVKAYTQQVTAYTQHVSAYKTYVEAFTKGHRAGAYELVVKDVLVSLLNAFLTALFGYVFITTGARMVRGYVEAKYARRNE
ncbi:MAG: hypothetical protein H0T60_16285 [Acidobacteria bacterium]|nr:hypothetical protein [Acidobacteriota bacterium]